MSGLLALRLISAPSASTINLPAPHAPGQRFALHCIAPEHINGHSVLFVHGASFPTMLAFGFEFAPGDSWMSHMAQQGFLACGLEFLGFGASSRPTAIARPAQGAAPAPRASEAAQEIAVTAEALPGAWWTITAEAHHQQLRFKNVLPAGLTLLEPAVAQRRATVFDAPMPLRGKNRASCAFLPARRRISTG